MAKKKNAKKDTSGQVVTQNPDGTFNLDNTPDGVKTVQDAQALLAAGNVTALKELWKSDRCAENEFAAYQVYMMILQLDPGYDQEIFENFLDDAEKELPGFKSLFED